jgi:coniferyl-aldehyde dehydrogenase
MMTTTMPTTTQLQACYEVQRRHALEHPYPALEERLERLRALRAAVLAFKEPLAQAIAQDFSARSRDETLIAEILTTVAGIDHTTQHLRLWMRPQRRKVSMLFAPARNTVMLQPLGVVGIMVPWNYPVQLSLLPLVGALAAGNRAIIKLSEFTPHTNAVIQQLLGSCLQPEWAVALEGDVALSSAFAAMPWDHLLFTGSTSVGRLVMAAAAPHLTPLTLELGGKSPVIVAPDANLQTTAESIVFGKLLNAGQTCIAPDYVWVHHTQRQAFVQAMQQAVARLYPTLRNNPDYSAIINERQHARLQSWLQEAQEQGATITTCNPANESFDGTRKMPLHLIENAPEQSRVMQDEIFGPLLPIKTYNYVTEAMASINAGPRPLALYLFSHDRTVQGLVLEHTHSGGVTINETLLHVAQDDMPFGGCGPSGMGHYHGYEGFLRLSHAKAVHIRGRFNSARMAYPPYGKWIHKLIERWWLQ